MRQPLDTRFALPPNTVLDATYRIVRAVGQGGFGITYEAEDTRLGTTVALKEYYPDEFGDRDLRLSVRPKSERHVKSFEWGRQNFLREARTLARFEHPSIVRVTRVFEANSTAYMVMGFERGCSFEAWLKGLGRPPKQEELDALLAPLLQALEVMHAAHFLHRDIAPDNIIVRANGTPVLLDFGSARRAVAEMSRSLTGIVKAGYSPHEQYSWNSRLQGPWSDLYALGGTLYRAVTGKHPDEATLRVSDDQMAPAALAAKGGYRPGFLAAIDACLRVKQGDRPQSVAQLRSMLLEPRIATQQPTSRSAEITSFSEGTSRKARQRKIGPWLASAAILITALGAYGGYELTRRQRNAAVEPNKSATGLARTGGPMGREGLEEEGVAAGKAVSRKAEAEAEELAKDEERRRTAARQEPARPAPSPPSLEEPKPLGHLINLMVKLGNQPTDENKPWLGVDTEPLELSLALSLGLTSPNGALIFAKTADGPADRADIRIGDVIVAMNGAIANTSDLHSRLSVLTPGTEVPLEVWRTAEKLSDFVLTLRRLAEGGNGQAMYWLGKMYAGGIGTTRNDIEAVSWYRRGAEAGNMDATAALGIVLLAGRGVAIDPQEGLRLVKAAAATDQVEAMSRLGHVLLDGKIAGKDQHEAVHLFTKAAQAGHAPSMVALGSLYANGIGVQADPGKAEIWYKQAAERGHAGGTAGLGSLYESGMGVAMDLPRAAALYRRAADLGNAGAMANLGQLYAQGKGVAKSDATAINLFRKAADLGNANAMNNLAWMLQNGAGGLRKDPDEAAKLMLNAIDRGNEFSLKQMTLNSRAWTKEFRQALQKMLHDSGFYQGAIDGEFRESTIIAINAYINRGR